MALTSTEPGGFLCLGAAECSNGSGSGFKASQKKGNGLNLVEPGIEFGTPWYKASDLSTTPRQLVVWFENINDLKLWTDG